ncbi:MAG: FKBP-type peptidyl-prolyl cis-trans isomerase [Bacteroides sp.]|nr:FKBP-type peptidyl-prolyl cis-trans isomerase [Bacteroides sp.]MCM1413780.1 FKBP-type peptidyl-prolyl cis-trans isomerase [Bacteroides sp.]MCM1472201.1 FKBP-type peptidyl-prolyl cis-trans isomerase [Bacteroides sp.]
MAVCSTAFGRGYELTRQERDSVATALATIWGEYVVKKAHKDGPDVSAEYMRGLEEALNLASNNDAYLQGLMEGGMIAQRLQQVENVGGFKVDMARFITILKRAEKGRRTGFTHKTAEDYLNRVMTKISEDTKVVDNSAAFLEAKSKEEGIIKTPSGLLFEVITEGEGDQPLMTDEVLVNYVGTLIDGREFNRSDESSGAAFKIKDLIPGFAEGLTMMKRGGTYRLYIPAEIGYGPEGVVGLIPGGAATIFDVQMIDFRHLDADGNVISPEETPASAE